MINSGKIPKRLIILFTLTIVAILTITTGFAISVLGEIKENKSSNDFAVMVKEDGLWAISLSTLGNEIIIDKDGLFKDPNISPKGHNVAYTKDQNLYLAEVDLIQGKKQVIKISEKVLSYTWANNNDLVYSTEKGGLNGFNLGAKKSSRYIESQDMYQGLVGDGKGTVYGDIYMHYTKNGKQFIKDKGVISYELELGKEKIIVPSRPSSEDINGIADMGLMPTVAGISKDGAYVYIWAKVHSASTNSDGVAFGVYDAKNNKFTTFNKEVIFALAYKDNLAINPLDGRLPVLNNGGARDMNINKTLGQVDVTSGSFTNILPESMIATSKEPYGLTAKGMVTMTPAFSPDGKKVIFAASKARENMQQWTNDPHNIYTVELGTKKVEKITKGNSFDFAPNYISKGRAIVFARRIGDDISLWRLQDNKEELIAKGMKYYDANYYIWYYGHYKLESILDIHISEE
ncbi:MAG: PD40 domain-containing protein [Clostridiaceae bacterium]|nr:PD40 domain-containing protein [Clostridiaceae bacterium]